MKKSLVVLFVLAAIVLTGCGGSGEVTEQQKDAAAPETREEEIKLVIEQIAEEHYDSTSIKKVTVNENLGTEEEDDYLVLVYLSFDAKNTKKTSKRMIEMYGSDLAARLAGEVDISEITIFWEVPYLKEGDNVAKFNLQRSGDKMTFKEKWFDPLLN